MATATLTEQDVDGSLVAAQIDSGPSECYEVVDGQIVEEPPLGARESWVLLKLNFEIIKALTVDQSGSLAPEALFLLDDSRRLRRRPDLAFISTERWPLDKPAPSEAAWDVIPDLAIEIISPTDMIDDLMSKIEEYFAVGVRLVWVIHPKYRKLYAYQSPTNVQILDQNDTLSGGEMISGFSMPLSKIFAGDNETSGSEVST